MAITFQESEVVLLFIAIMVLKTPLSIL